MDIDFRPIFLIIGFLLIILSLGMLVPATIDLLAQNQNWLAFITSSLFTLFIGVATFISCRSGKINLNLRQAFLITTLSWIILPIFASIPFMISDIQLSFTDAFFESMSGITTTGATIIIGLDNMTTGLLIWRCILQWLGGLGIIIMAFTILPFLKVGGMQMFKIEGFDTHENFIPRATELASSLIIIFSSLTILWAFLYWLAGMNILDSISHSMTTIATGGYSNHDDSIGYFNSSAIEFIASMGMIAGGVPFLLYIQVLKGKPKSLFYDPQVIWFISIIIFFIILISLYLIIKNIYSPLDALRFASFNTISVLTGTGYASEDFGAWGAFPIVIFFLLMFVGGCAGSTTCGIKIFRFQILIEVVRVQLKKLSEPHGVFTPQFNRHSLDDDITSSVVGFFYLYLLTVCILATCLAALDIDFLTALSGAASAVSNVGPGLGAIIGPSGTYSSLPDIAKWLLSIGMLLGRLELFTVIVLILPKFWRN